MTKPAQHTQVLGHDAVAIPADERPEAGPIAVLPARGREEAFVAAVERAGGEVAELSDKTRGVIYTSASDVETLTNTLQAHPQIGWVQLPFAGIDSYAKKLAPFAERGVLFTSGKGAYSQPVAEHALMLTLALQRLVPKRVLAESWGKADGQSFYGATVVMFGGGGIAREYLRLIKPFGVHTIVVRRSEGEVDGADRTVTNDQLDEVLPTADVVMLAAPATDDTRHIINAERLRAMKSNAVLVNIGRGPLVDTDALVEALANGEIAGAGLDVTDPEPLPAGHPLFRNERAIITPHSADTPAMVQPLLERRIEDNVSAFLDTGKFVGIADPTIGY